MKRRVLVLEGGRASAAEVAAGGKGRPVALEGSQAPIPCPDEPALKNVLSELALANEDRLIVVADAPGRQSWRALLADARLALPGAWELRCLEPLLPYAAQGKNMAASLARHLASLLDVEAPLAPLQKEREELQKAIAQEEADWQQERERLRAEIETLKRQRDALRGNLDGERLATYLPALYQHVFTVVSPTDLALLCGTLEPPNIPNPYPEPAPETLRRLQADFRALPVDVQRRIVRFAQDLPQAARLAPRHEMRELIATLGESRP